MLHNENAAALTSMSRVTSRLDLSRECSGQRRAFKTQVDQGVTTISPSQLAKCLKRCGPNSPIAVNDPQKLLGVVDLLQSFRCVFLTCMTSFPNVSELFKVRHAPHMGARPVYMILWLYRFLWLTFQIPEAFQSSPDFWMQLFHTFSFTESLLLTCDEGILCIADVYSSMPPHTKECCFLSLEAVTRLLGSISNISWQRSWALDLPSALTSNLSGPSCIKPDTDGMSILRLSAKPLVKKCQ